MSELWLSPNAYDATRLRDLLLCRRRFKLAHILQLERAHRNSFNIHLEWGKAWHETVRAYDTARATAVAAPINVAIQRAFDLTKEWPVDTGVRTKSRETLVRAIIWYDDQFGANNPLMPLMVEGNGPAFELNFRFPLFADQPNGPLLCGNLDGIVEFGGEIWILERKSTATTLSGFYWDKFDPNVQVDVYCVAAHLLWPQWQIKGVLVEACQTGVTFARFERKLFRRSPARLEETLASLQREVASLLRDLSEYGEDSEETFGPRYASCSIDNGCPFRDICQTDPSMREWEIATHWQRRTDPWDPINRNNDESSIDAPSAP